MGKGFWAIGENRKKAIKGRVYKDTAGSASNTSECRKWENFSYPKKEKGSVRERKKKKKG